MKNNPYIGPTPFKRGQKLYGRESETRVLAETLIAERVALLYSPSGAGKTSLIHAGLIPLLEDKREFFVYPTIRLGALGEGAHADNGLVESAVASLCGSDSADRPAIDGVSVHRRLYAALNEQNQLRGTGRKLLIIDQCEEVFNRRDVASDDVLDFVGIVENLLRAPTLYLLIAIREEFLAHFDELVFTVPLAARLRLSLLRVAEAKTAIVEPAASNGLTVTSAAADALVEELSRPSKGASPLASSTGLVEPVLLQVVCKRMWDSLPEGTRQLTPEQVRRPGKEGTWVERALREYCSEAIDDAVKASKLSQYRVRELIVNRLMTSEGTRRLVSEDEFVGDAGAHLKQSQLETALGALDDAHLVRLENRGGRRFYELSHDRLVSPLRRGNEEWMGTHLESFRQQAREWKRDPRPSLLLEPRELARATTWADANPGEVAKHEVKFIAASKADMKKRQLRAGLIFIGLGVVAVVCMAVAGVMHKLKDDVETQKRATADALVDSSITRATLLAGLDDFSAAQQALTEAGTNEPSVAKQHASNLLRWFIHLSVLNPSSRDDMDSVGKPLTAALYVPAKDWLVVGGKYGYRSIRKLPEGKTEPKGTTSDTTVTDMQLSDDGKKVIALSDDGRVHSLQSWPLDEVFNAPAEISGKHPTEEIRFFLPAPADEVIIATLRTDTSRWSLYRGVPGKSPKRTWTFGPAMIESPVTLGPMVAGKLDADLLFVANERAVIRYDSKLTKDQQTSRAWPGSPVTAMALSPDERHLVTGSIDGSISMFALVADKTVIPADCDQRQQAYGPLCLVRRVVAGDEHAPVRELKFLDNARFLSGSEDGRIRLWDSESLVPMRLFDGHDGSVQAFAIKTDGTQEAKSVFSVGLDGRVIPWPIKNDAAVELVNARQAPDGSCEGTCADGFPVSIALAPDLDRMAVGYDSGDVALYSLASHSTLHLEEAAHRDVLERSAFTKARAEGILKTPAERKVRRLAFDPTGTWLASAGDDGQVHLWRTSSNEMTMLPGASLSFKLPVTGVAFVPVDSGAKLAASSNDGRVALLSINDRGERIASKYFPDEGNGEATGDENINSVSVDCSGKVLITTRNVGPTLRWINGDDLGEVISAESSFPKPTQKVTGAELFGPNGPLVDFGLNGLRRVFTAPAASPENDEALPGHYYYVRRAALDPYAWSLLSMDTSGVIRVHLLDDDGNSLVGRDLFALHTPALLDPNSQRKTPAVDFSFACQYGATNTVGDCKLAATLGSRQEVVVYDFKSQFAITSAASQPGTDSCRSLRVSAKEQ